MNWLDYFRRWAGRYEMEVEAYGYRPERLIKPFLPLIGKREVCIDVGCGTGKSLEVISKICKRVLGVEPVERMARRAREKGFKVLNLRGEELSRIKTEADLVTFFASIDYMEVGKVVKEVKKVLKKGGMVFLTVEPENRKRVVEAFKIEGFIVVKEVEKRAYEGQRYVCVLLKLACRHPPQKG